MLNNTVEDVTGAHDASSHDANMLLCYFRLWQNRDSPSGLAVESPCTVPVRSTMALCKDRTRYKEFISSGLTRNARERRREGGEERREEGGQEEERLMGANVSRRNWESEKKEEQS